MSVEPPLLAAIAPVNLSEAATRAVAGRRALLVDAVSLVQACTARAHAITTSIGMQSQRQGGDGIPSSPTNAASQGPPPVFPPVSARDWTGETLMPLYDGRRNGVSKSVNTTLPFFLCATLRRAALRAAARKHDDDFRKNAPWFGPAPPPSPLLTLATLRAPKPRKPLREAPG